MPQIGKNHRITIHTYHRRGNKIKNQKREKRQLFHL